MAYYYVDQFKYRRRAETYKQKLDFMKRIIVEYVHENAALVDELEEVQTNIIIRKEERKFLLRKLCEYEPHAALEVQKLAKGGSLVSVSGNEVKKKRKAVDHHQNSVSKLKNSNGTAVERRPSLSKSRKPMVRNKKRFVQPIPLDSTGRPLFPIELGSLTIHSLGEVVSEHPEFHCEDAIYPVGYVSTRIYGSLKDPTVRCVYTCKISSFDDMPRFEIAADDDCPPIVGDSPDLCHSLLLQKINDSILLNVVSTRPRGHEFFGLTHSTVLNLIQSSPGTRKCLSYKWTKFEVLRNGEMNQEYNDAGLSFDYLQKSINFCRYKMAPDVLQKPSDFIENI